MPFFKLKNKQPKSKPVEVTNGAPPAPVRARWQSSWNSTEIQPDEVDELLHAVTAELRLRAEALDSPFLLLPFRPNSEQSSARPFMDAFFKNNANGSQQSRGASLEQELRLTSPAVLCSILKWCWSRIPKGVVSWPVYESFQLGEKESNMARNAFDTFIPLGSDSQARTNIIIDFFSLLSAVAAHGKSNGLGGRKLSRLAGWWAFEHKDDGTGFEGGYKSWSKAADASSHLLFAYLRSLSPEMEPSLNVIERIPRSLQALLAQTEYPPETPMLLQRTTSRVVMLVDQVSSTPFSLLRRAKHFEFRQNDRVLQEYSEFDDPVDALTDECKRVLYAIATTNSARVVRSRHGLNKPDETWSSFTSLGFGDLSSDPTPPAADDSDARGNGSISHGQGGLRAPARPGDINRPTTPSWGDFMSSGFENELGKSPSTMLLPPDKILPPIGNRKTPSIMSTGTDYDDEMTPGELAAVASVELDDAFWWVWMTSLAGEESKERKAVFGRCALIETNILNGTWLIMEEQLKGASPDPIEGAVIVEKKGRFSFTKRGRLGRGKSNSKKQLVSQAPVISESVAENRSNRMTLGVDQQAKIKAAAVALSQKNDASDHSTNRRGRQDDGYSTKTNSMLTLGLQSEAGPAMKWATSYDKDNIRAAYLGSNLTGIGENVSMDNLSHPYTNSVHGDDQSHSAAQTAAAPTELPQSHAAAGAPRDPSPIKNNVSEPFVPQPSIAQPPVQKPQATATTYDASQKEFGIPSRPSASNDEHPAFRNQQPAYDEPAISEKSITQSSDANPALTAARLALEGRSASPDMSKSNMIKKQPGSAGGLRKLFSRKDKTNRQSMDVHQAQAVSSASSAANDSALGHNLAKQPSPPSPPRSYSPVQAKAQPHVEPAVAAAAAVMPASHGKYNDSAADLSRVDSQEERDADIAFSRFDQGPIDDMPATAPVESPEVPHAPPHEEPDTLAKLTGGIPEEEVAAAEPPSVPRYTPPAATSAPYVPQPRSGLRGMTVHDRVASIDDAQSEATMQDRRAPISTASTSTSVDPSKDRWERIRENAARRAANARASEETSTLSRPTQSSRTDDGETSGEETIESRVARIKARVAELTGNIESGSSSSYRRDQPAFGRP